MGLPYDASGKDRREIWYSYKRKETKEALAKIRQEWAERDAAEKARVEAARKKLKF